MKRSAPPRMPSRAVALSRAAPVAPVAWPPRAATVTAAALAGALWAARPAAAAAAGVALAGFAAAAGTAWLLSGWLHRRAGR